MDRLSPFQGLHFFRWLHRAMPCFDDLARFGAIFKGHQIICVSSSGAIL